MSVEKKQYGLWDSPITPVSLARGITFSDVIWDTENTLVWREVRSGQGTLVLRTISEQSSRDLNSETSVRAGVGYGGGDFTVGAGYAYFVEAKSGRIYRQPLQHGVARPVTPGFGSAASPILSPDGHWLLYVHTYEDQDSLGIVDAAGVHWPGKLVSGDDFYMQPAWHPDGHRLAWVSWNFPNMPWDGAYLHLGRLALGNENLPVLKEEQVIAGAEDKAIFQPEFSPDGRYLAYASDETGWWQIYLYDLESGESRQLTSEAAEHATPAWIQGQRTYGFSSDSRFIYYLKNKNGFASLWRVDLTHGEHQLLPVGEEYKWMEQLAVSPDGGSIAMIASGSYTPPRVIVYHLSGQTQVLKRSQAENLPAAAYASPQALTWAGMDGEMVYGLMYLPQNESFEGIGLPPLMVLIHGGPTSQRTACFDGQVQFFTSRGYAVLQVNHRGSTGYGRLYRDKLRGNWGVYDVQDAVSGVRHFVEAGLVDGNRVAIMGGSAGGFTVLKALEDYPGFFKAGINLFGVSNQFNFIFDTHKFEARYSDYLLGPWPESASIYRERSPIFYADNIQDPVAIFQGAEDKVVLRNQSDDVVASLSKRGIPHVYHVYEGEGHGFRKTETIEQFHTEVARFLRQYVILT